MKIVKNINIVLPDKVIENGFIGFENGKITIVESDLNLIPENAEIIETSAKFIMPGFIDIHSHGGYGYDFMNPNADALKDFSKKVFQEGTTTILGTTMTESYDAIKQAIANVAAYDQSNVEIPGIHLEGPFLSVGFKGAQPGDKIINPDVAIFKDFNEQQNIKLVTLAPEEDADFNLIKYCKENNIVASIGHSGASCATCKAAFDAGVKSITHFYNGQSALNHREIGVVGAGLLYGDAANAELICDLIHVNADAINMVVKNKGYDKITLITDSMEAKGLTPGEYSLGGIKIIVDESSARQENGTLAGSIAKFNNCAANFKTVTNCSWSELSKVTSLNQAKLLNMDNVKGSLEVGKDADFVLIDENVNVINTIKAGRLV